MRFTGIGLFLWGVLCFCGNASDLPVLCYHDVRDEVVDDLDPDRFATGTDRLVSQFEWLRQHGYQPVSVDDVIAARSGGQALPNKAVLLTFDDALVSFYTRVFPLLELYRFPALLAVVGSWLEAAEDTEVEYGGRPLARSDFVGWPELREIVDSGLVEVASHSYDLHRGVRGNPQGNQQAAAVTRIFDFETESYETTASYRERIRSDLERNATLIERELGVRPRVMVWPYGAYNSFVLRIAEDLGMPLSMSLDPGVNELQLPGEPPVLKRQLVKDNLHLSSFVELVSSPEDPGPVRVVQVDLDYIYDPDPAQQERNLGVLLDRIKRLQVSTVYLQAFADPDGDGTASALYFPNRHLPVRADLFNRVAWQLRTRAKVRVYGWLPVLAFDLPDPDRSKRLSVQELFEGRRRVSRNFYRRLSPYNQEARSLIGEIYEDLAVASHVDGLLFHDDAYLGENEDASVLDIPGMTAISAPREKSKVLLNFTAELAGRVRSWRPQIRTARNIYAAVALGEEGERLFSQNLELSLDTYDYIALMAMPYMENADSPLDWLTRLVRKVSDVPGALEKTVFELQSVDWRSKKPVPSEMLARQLAHLQRLGTKHLGYYPDDFLNNRPDLETIRPEISAATYPYRRRP